MSKKSWIHSALLVSAVAALAGTVAAQSVGALGANGGGAPPAQEGFGNYVAPSGPLLTAGAVAQIALHYAGQAGDARPPEVTESSSTFAAAQAALEPGAPIGAQATAAPVSGGDSGGAQGSAATSAWLASSADLVVMHGNFTANLPVPKGDALPSGDVYALILDAHTGFPEGRYIGHRAPAVGSLGPVTSLVSNGSIVATAAAVQASVPRSGIAGRVRPGAARGEAARRGWRIVLVRADGPRGSTRQLASTRTDRAGRFSIRIKPGRYFVEVWLTGTLRCLPRAIATVHAGRITRVEPGCPLP
jgi:hypothetical protein